MKSWDLLLEWMTHIGSGAWESFREAVQEVSNDDSPPDEDSLIRTLRIALSDLGHVDFFVDGSRRWRVRRPALVGLSDRGEYLLVGGRTRSLMEQFCDAVASRATVKVTESIPGLSRVQVTGDPEFLQRAIEGIEVEYLADAALRLSAQLPGIRRALETTHAAEEPINWSVRSWSFRDEKWVNERLDRTVREYRNRHGIRRYFVHIGTAGLREIEKRVSIYCAALIRSTRIVRYSYVEMSLRVPRWAPLPEAYARCACLTAGRLGSISEDEILFEGIDPQIASTLLVTLGQGFPMPEAKR